MNLSLNQSLFLWLNQVCTALPDWVWASLTIMGHTSMVFALLTPLLLPHLRSQGGARIITALFICSVLGGLAATLVKESLQLHRPAAVLAADSFHLIGHKLDLVSFPSGHTLTAFAVATLLILGFGLRRWKMTGLLVLACGIGFSRIAVGAHWPMDVLGGAMIGSLCGHLSLIAANYLHRRYAGLTCFAYQLTQIVILGAVSLSLFWTHMGYPNSIYWQCLMATFGVITSAYSIYSHLLTLKYKKIVKKE